MAVETREYRAEARFQRVSPQKARLVLELIKGRGVQEALDDGGLYQEAHRPGDLQAADLGGGQREVRVRRAGHRSGRGQSLRQDGRGQRRTAHEAHPPCPHGTGLSLPAPADAHRAVGGRARRIREPGDQGRRAAVAAKTEAPKAAPKAAKKKVAEPKAAKASAKKSGTESRNQGGRQDGRRSKEKGRQVGLEVLRGKAWDRKSILTDSGWE